MKKAASQSSEASVIEMVDVDVASSYAPDVLVIGAGPGGYVVANPPMDEAAAPAPAPGPQAAAPQTAAPQSANWYYCESAKAYYPYVAECKEGWRQVPATPPR